MCKKLFYDLGLFQRLRYLLRPQNWNPSQRSQRLIGMDLAKYELEHLHTEASPHSPGHNGIHLPQHPCDRFRRHDADHGFHACARKTRYDAPHIGRVQVPDQLPGGALSTRPDQLLDLTGDFGRLVQ